MQEAMINRRKNNADAGNERDPAEQRIATRKEFACHRLDGRERTHAGKNHRRVRKRVQPRESFEIMVTGHPDEK